MITVKNDGFLDRQINDLLRKDYPQINSKTKLVLTDDTIVEKIIMEEMNVEARLFKPSYENIRKHIKDILKENLGAVINDKHYLLKIVDQFIEAHRNNYLIKHLKLKPYGFKDCVLNENHHFWAYYEPETDTLYYCD